MVGEWAYYTKEWMRVLELELSKEGKNAWDRTSANRMMKEGRGTQRRTGCFLEGGPALLKEYERGGTHRGLPNH
jgi:hypothetical protein